MPELAEVETVKRYLDIHILNNKITAYFQHRDNLRAKLAPDIANHVLNQQIIGLGRRAKFLHIYLENGYVLTFHLGMSGRLTCKNLPYEKQKHDHIIIELDREKVVVFNDARRFGMVYGCSADELIQQDFLKNMGPEPLENGFNDSYMQNILCNKKSPIKTVLMDNRVVVGVGNIYAAESLFLAKIHPARIAKTLRTEEIHRLVAAVKTVLSRAIESGGTTLRDFVNGDNNPGYFQQKLMVYGKKHSPCSVCSSVIKHIKQAGRSSFFCDNCQK